MDYFTAFGIEFLNPLALPLAVLLSTFEFVLGSVILFNIKPKLSSWIVLIFMGFFTLLTLYLAFENPVHDCGCFGDAIVMTNWQTFWKNIIIMVFIGFIFFGRRKFQPSSDKRRDWAVPGISAVIILAFSIYCYQHLPIIDFRPYKTGTHIPDKMKIPEGAPKPKYKTILKYKKNGKIKEFTMDSLPDSTWQWVETKNIKVKEGYKPPIDDFTISTLDGEDITDIVLSQEKFTFLLIAYDLEKADQSDMDDIVRLSEYCNNTSNCSFIGLTSSLEKTIKEFKEKTGASFPFYQSDEITLKTIVRANPGLMLIKKGTILDKWHNNDTPSPGEIKEDFLNNEKYREDKGDQSESKEKPEEIRS
jgi:uncharacterized membrane protein YphA (DoxX/SURF4 family)